MTNKSNILLQYNIFMTALMYIAINIVCRDKRINLFATKKNILWQGPFTRIATA